MLIGHSGRVSQKFFPVLVILTFFLLFFNLLGMFPWGFTITSHFIITFFSFFIPFSINIIGVEMHGVKFSNLFLPSGTPLMIMPFLFLIEVLSYLSRLFSLSIRLFANMMSGHTLIHILVSFIFLSLSYGNLILIINLFPIFIIHVIIFMELCIALLQVYVFLVLSCLYINDIINLTNH